MSWFCKIFDFTATSAEMVVTHDLGQIPDIVVVSVVAPATTDMLQSSGGLSTRLLEQIQENTGESYNVNIPTILVSPSVGSGFRISTNLGIESDMPDRAEFGCVRECTDTTFKIGSTTSNYPLLIGKDYSCTLIWNDGSIDGSDIPQTFRTLTTSKNNGSYQIIDLKDINLTVETPVKYDGYYNIINNTRKVINLSGITIDGVKHQDSFISMFKSEDTYMCYLYNRTFVFYPNDELIIYQGKIEPAQYNYIEEDDL